MSQPFTAKHFLATALALLVIAACTPADKRDTVQELEERVVLLEHKLRESESRLQAKIDELEKARGADETPNQSGQQPHDGPQPNQPEPEALKTFEPEAEPADATATPTDEAAAQPKPEPTPETAYQDALSLIRTGRSAEAKTAFEAFLARHVNHKLAPNALYWLGEAEYDMGNFNRAALTFQQVTDRFAESSKAADALLKMGRSREKLGQMDAALEAYRQVIALYPKSRAAKIARDWL